MSRIGKLPVEIPQSVNVEIGDRSCEVKGPKGQLKLHLPGQISIKEVGNQLLVEVKSKDKLSKALHGTIRAHLANMVRGVTEGWSKELEMVGTGYRAQVNGNVLSLTIGYSHPVEITAPEGITFNIEKNNITVQGVDKEAVGQIAATIRAVRPPEPYKGKGIKYTDEVVRRKPGKAAKAAGAAA